MVNLRQRCCPAWVAVGIVVGIVAIAIAVAIVIKKLQMAGGPLYEGYWPEDEEHEEGLRYTSDKDFV